MLSFTNIEEYLSPFEEIIKMSRTENKRLVLYFNSQIQQLKDLIEAINSDSFWEIFPEILGIDAKLMLLIELIGFEDFPTQEILRIVEEDYRFYFKELCGYDLSMETRPSIIFNVA